MSLGMNTAKVRYDGKPLFYHSDGTGRDSYIVRNNGGLLSQAMLRNLECKWERKADYIPMKLGTVGRSQKKSLPSMGDKFVHYFSDGTGRDSYVGINHGGRINNFNSKNNTESLFRSSLRAYQKMPSLSNLHSSQADFDFSNTNFYLSERQLHQKNLTHLQQSKSSLRLSKPKVSRIPSHSYEVSQVESRYNYYPTQVKARQHHE